MKKGIKTTRQLAQDIDPYAYYTINCQQCESSIFTFALGEYNIKNKLEDTLFYDMVKHMRAHELIVHFEEKAEESG